MKTMAFEDQITSLRIPTFRIPWPEACSPDAEVVETQTIAWAESHGLFANYVYRERVERTRYGFLAARCYPNAQRELLQIISDYFLWFFLADDLFVDRVDTITSDTLRNLTAMIDVLDFDRTGIEPVYGESAWLDVCRRFRSLLSAEHFERFAQGMRLWATTAGLQILNHLQDVPAGIRQYQTIRRHTSGMNPCLALSDAANKGPVDPDIYYRFDVKRLRLCANNIVCWSNDIQSLGVEIRQPGQFWNMVGAHAAAGHSLQESVDYTATRVNTEIGEFIRLAKAIRVNAGVQLCGLVDGLEYWIRGYMDWVMQDTKRYAPEFAANDADDRDVFQAS